MTIEPASSNLVFRGSTGQCLSHSVSLQDTSSGVPDSDLHIYVIYENNAASPAKAYGKHCQIDVHPTFGLISLNVAHINDSIISSNFQFQIWVKLIIH